MDERFVLLGITGDGEKTSREILRIISLIAGVQILFVKSFMSSEFISESMPELDIPEPISEPIPEPISEPIPEPITSPKLIKTEKRRRKTYHDPFTRRFIPINELVTNFVQKNGPVSRDEIFDHLHTFMDWEYTSMSNAIDKAFQEGSIQQQKDKWIINPIFAKS
jgi:hypothetical protein